MKVLVFGGAFNPVTITHMLMGMKMSKQYDEVWFTPCNTSRYGKEMVPFAKRCKMLYAALKETNNPKLKVCQAESYYGIDGKMLDLVRKLRDNNPSVEFDYLIGMDSAQNIEHWYKAKNLIHEATFMVIRRDDCKAPKWIKKANFMFGRPWNRANRIIPLIVPSRVSSTLCRYEMKFNGDSINLVESVKQIIREEGFYGCK